MKKIINDKVYYIPSNLTKEQEAIYCHIIDWKKEKFPNLKRGMQAGHEYDAFFPQPNPAIPPMVYEQIRKDFEKMQHGVFAYKSHLYAKHAVSSQTACINLFMPLLLSDKADDILTKIPGCPSDFNKIARDKLFNGFCFEYWGQDIKEGKGVLNDHTAGAGTDADVAIAYYNTTDELCLWLIEHKLSEKEFTKCGGYKSKNNQYKVNCQQCDLINIMQNPKNCIYHTIKYEYWNILKEHKDKYQGDINIKGCPFRGGLNQLWRNQMLAFALQDTGAYKTVTFSVCHHAKNSMLNKTMDQYKKLTCNDKMFNSFTNYDVLDAVCFQDSDLQKWKDWYKEVYYF